MSDPATPSCATVEIERAYVGSELIGYRLSLNGVPGLLVWADQTLLPGWRVGSEFVAPLGREVRYEREPAKEQPR